MRNRTLGQQYLLWTNDGGESDAMGQLRFFFFSILDCQDKGCWSSPEVRSMMMNEIMTLSVMIANVCVGDLFWFCSTQAVLFWSCFDLFCIANMIISGCWISGWDDQCFVDLFWFCSSQAVLFWSCPTVERDRCHFGLNSSLPVATCPLGQLLFKSRLIWPILIYTDLLTF